MKKENKRFTLIKNMRKQCNMAIFENKNKAVSKKVNKKVDTVENKTNVKKKVRKTKEADKNDK